jgi:DNA-binding transcriptional LysR family regulator
MRFDLNLKQLKTFYYVAKNLSFTRAAEELFVTQPAVTMQVDALERHYGTRLLTREKKNLALTEAGALLFSYAERIMLLAFEADQAMLNLRTHPRGVLHIGTTKTWARVLMPSYILGFQERFPDIHINLDEGSSEEMAASVIYGRNDLAIVGRVPYDARLEILPFPGHETDELILAVHPDHPLATRTAVSFADIQGEPLILREQGSGIRHVIVRQAEEQGLNLNVLLEASLTRISAEEEVKAGIIAAVSFAEGGLWVHVDMALPREGHRTAAVRSLLEYLTETAGVDDLRNTGEAPAASGPEA